MFTTIQRRIAWDIVSIFIVSLLALTLLAMTIGVAREAINQGLGFFDVLRLIPYAAPNALALAVPGTTLFSLCCVFGRMSADNELLAMQSVGLSHAPAILPALGIALLLSFVTVGLINTAFTWGFHGVQHVVMSSIEQIAYGVLERERNFHHQSLSLTVRDVQGETLISPVIQIRRENKASIMITAETAVMKYDPHTEGLTFRITNGVARVGNQAAFSFPDTLEQTVSLVDDEPYDLLSANPSHMSMSDLPQATIKQRSDIRGRESEKAVACGFNLLTARPDACCDEAARDRDVGIDASRKRLHRIKAEIHRRWACGFTCLALAMVGIPFAIRMKTADTMSSFGAVFLPTLLVYYPIFAITLNFAKDGRIPPYGVWTANAVFVAISLLMMRKNV